MQQSQQESKQDNRIQDFLDWQGISEHNGWLVYKRELEKEIENYKILMDNPNANGELLKNCQLIKRGLEKALGIPKILEIKAKQAKKGAKNAEI